MMMGMPDDMIGAIKIKDGLFIGDEFAAQVSRIVPESHFPPLLLLISGIKKHGDLEVLFDGDYIGVLTFCCM